MVTAFNLRQTAVAIGPVLLDLQSDLGMSDSAAGFLTSLPGLAFAAFGLIASPLSHRFGIHRVNLVALLLVTLGTAARAQTHGTWSFLAWSVVALAGMALGNVLLPSLVKRHFGTRIGMMTGVYSTVMQVGVVLTSFATAPLALRAGSWRPVFTAMAALPLVAAIPWLALSALDRDEAPRPAGEHRHRLWDLARTRLGWTMALYFGFQSAQAYAIFGWLPSIYSAAGMPSDHAGLMLGLCTLVGLPLAYAVPVYTARNPSPYGATLVFLAFALAGYLGLLLAPLWAPWLWAVLVAVGIASFPMILALISMRTRTHDGTILLSAFTQSLGYVIAAPGPLLVGILRDATGGFTWPLITLMILAVLLAVMGLLAARPRFLEDELTD